MPPLAALQRWIGEQRQMWESDHSSGYDTEYQVGARAGRVAMLADLREWLATRARRGGQ